MWTNTDLNRSIGAQSDSYPNGYRARSFRVGQQADGRCVPVLNPGEERIHWRSSRLSHLGDQQIIRRCPCPFSDLKRRSQIHRRHSDGI